jgi:phospholipase/carboxylesterase
MEKNSRCKIPYLPVKRMREMYPDGSFVVIGEIGNIARTLPGQDTLLISNGAEVSIFPRGCMRRPFEWIVGYVAVEENTYIAVVQNLLSIFLPISGTKK